MIYPRAFFDLQLQFAARVTTLTGVPLAQALLQYTNLYIRFGLGHDFDPAHPTWQAYVAGVRDTRDVREWTHTFYLKRPDMMAAPSVVATFGCFAYARPPGEWIRLHFQNAETEGHSPLAIDRVGERWAELATLFAHARRTLPHPLQVRGVSWLYNLEAYRRLFPTSYLATAHVAAQRFQHMPLWGQFVDRHGAMKEPPTRRFRERLERASNLDGLAQCFPLQPLAVHAPAQVFYDFYGL